MTGECARFSALSHKALITRKKRIAVAHRLAARAIRRGTATAG